jgi:tRNA pseudouridine55 synthase
VDKPSGPTSHDVVDQVRRGLGLRRVGHAGTLDPLASGLLPLVLGRATRLVRFLPHSPKIYRGAMRLGLTTTTDDSDGEVVSREPGRVPESAAVLEAARGLLGRRLQHPPAYSARKHGGQPLYRLARRGVRIDVPPAEVLVQRFDLAPTEQPDRYTFEAEVSSGTYVRALVRDLGQDLGCGGCLTALTRTRIGPMRLEDATRLPDRGLESGWLAGRVLPLEAMPLDLGVVHLEHDEQARLFLRGVAIRLDTAIEGPVRVLLPCGSRLAGVAEGRAGRLHPRVVLSGVEAPAACRPSPPASTPAR